MIQDTLNWGTMDNCGRYDTMRAYVVNDWVAAVAIGKNYLSTFNRCDNGQHITRDDYELITDTIPIEYIIDGELSPKAYIDYEDDWNAIVDNVLRLVGGFLDMGYDEDEDMLYWLRNNIDFVLQDNIIWPCYTYEDFVVVILDVVEAHACRMTPVLTGRTANIYRFGDALPHIMRSAVTPLMSYDCLHLGMPDELSNPFPITYDVVRNFDNNRKLVKEWVLESHACIDKAERELCVVASQAFGYDWTSKRSDVLNRLSIATPMEVNKLETQWRAMCKEYRAQCVDNKWSWEGLLSEANITQIDPIIILLREARINRQVSQRELSLKMDIDESSLVEIESGKRSPSLETVRRCLYLEVDIKAFIEEPHSKQ